MALNFDDVGQLLAHAQLAAANVEFNAGAQRRPTDQGEPGVWGDTHGQQLALYRLWQVKMADIGYHRSLTRAEFTQFHR